VKELSFEEVLRIPGGRPFAAALDELTYRSPLQSVADPIDYAHTLGAPSPVRHGLTRAIPEPRPRPPIHNQGGSR